MTKAGQAQGKGLYRCVKCGRMQVVEDVKKSLKPCPTCNEIRFTP